MTTVGVLGIGRMGSSMARALATAGFEVVCWNRTPAAARSSAAGLLDAPVSGSVALAESGGLTIMVGGETANLDRARPVLDALGKTVFHMVRSAAAPR